MALYSNGREDGFKNHKVSVRVRPALQYGQMDFTTPINSDVPEPTHLKEDGE